MDGLQVRLFGEASVRHEDEPVHFPSGKALELFCYLLVHRDRVHNREALSEVLWPGGKLAASKRYLRQALWRLNTTLSGRSAGSRTEAELLLSVDLDWVRINPAAEFWLDVSAFDRMHSAIRDTPGHLLSDRQAQELETVLELYRGDLLATWCYDWCGYERDRLQFVYLTMLDQLMAYCEARRLYPKGLSLGQVGLRHDPVRERTYRQLMRLHYGAGDRTAAIRQYERCASVMARELGIGPSAGTETLYAQICADRVPDISTSPVVPPTQQPVPEPPDALALTDLRLRLDQIQASLRTLQETVLQINVMRFEHARNGERGP